MRPPFVPGTDGASLPTPQAPMARRVSGIAAFRRVKSVRLMGASMCRKIQREVWRKESITSHRRLRSTESTDADTGLSSGGFPHYTSHLLLQKLHCTKAGSGSVKCLLRQGSHRLDNHLFIQQVLFNPPNALIAFQAF